MSTAARTKGTLLYDPDCGFCTRTAMWLAARARDVVVAPLGPAEIALHDIDSERALREVPYVLANGRIVWGAAAIAEALAGCRQPWSVGGKLLRLAPVQVIARPVYAWVSANRYRLPGGSASCRLDTVAPRNPDADAPAGPVEPPVTPAAGAE